MLSLIVAVALAQQPVAPASPPADAPLDFTAEAKLLYRIVACAGDTQLPPGIDTAVVESHCRETRRRIGKYQGIWTSVAKPYLVAVKPAGLPATVVYPFGGGDLISALTTYPDAVELNTVSLEYAGDPRRINGLSSDDLKRSLAQVRAATAGLLVANGSKTSNLMKVQRGELPGQLSFFLLGLAAHGFEPVALRYFSIEPDGTLRYLTRSELEAEEQAKAKLLHRAWVSPDFSEAFSNMELVFAKQGEGPSAGVRVHRHIAANLDDAHFLKNEPLKRYLAARGKVATMTKGASYLLWRDSFSGIRTYLLESTDFMISDSTGIPPSIAAAAGFSQQAYGRYESSFLNASPSYNAEFRALWKHAKPLPFRYGYVDKLLQKHMLITWRTGAVSPPADPPMQLASQR